MKKPNSLLVAVQTFFDRYKLFFVLAFIALVLLLPVFSSSPYFLRIVIMIMVYSCLALALNILTGYTGQVSLGNAGFFAIGAYTTAILTTRLEWSFWPSMLASFLIAGLSGFLLGIPTLRMKGSYLSIVTLGFGEIVRLLLLNWDSLTRGPLGIRSIPSPMLFGFELMLENNGSYYLIAFMTFVITLACYFVVNSKIGRAFEAIKEDELVASIMGVNTTRYKVLAFVMSASITGIIGAFYATFVHYIDPNIFSFDTSILILSIVILGGMGTIPGMFVGAILLVSFPEVLRFLNEYRFVTYGIILVLMMRFRPQGLLGGRTHTKLRLSKYSKYVMPEDRKEVVEG